MSRVAIGFIVAVLLSGPILGQQPAPPTILNCKTVVFNQALNTYVCGECNLSYFAADSGRMCSPCSNICLRCSGTASTCQECKIGYYLSSSTCSMCSTGCKSCTNNISCDSCNSGYFRVSTTQGSSCTKCISNCMECTTTSDCITCFSTYTKTVENGTVSCKMNGMGIFLVIILILILICVCACIAWAMCIYCCAKTVFVEDRSSFAEVQPTTVVVQETYY